MKTMNNQTQAKAKAKYKNPRNLSENTITQLIIEGREWMIDAEPSEGSTRIGFTAEEELLMFL